MTTWNLTMRSTESLEKEYQTLCDYKRRKSQETDDVSAISPNGVSVLSQRIAEIEKELWVRTLMLRLST